MVFVLYFFNVIAMILKFLYFIIFKWLLSCWTQYFVPVATHWPFPSIVIGFNIPDENEATAAPIVSFLLYIQRCTGTAAQERPTRPFTHLQVVDGLHVRSLTVGALLDMFLRDEPESWRELHAVLRLPDVLLQLLAIHVLTSRRPRWTACGAAPPGGFWSVSRLPAKEKKGCNSYHHLLKNYEHQMDTLHSTRFIWNMHMIDDTLDKYSNLAAFRKINKNDMHVQYQRRYTKISFFAS
jgi:hypothetical protein